ncbi:TetR/AcrR family transcriptional regulator [Asticcacaulis machinosus]|uniref:TetR/AcrR family transcriptional regulator n=1 Tax=Asticcacaulis machinosus TaxID=2984211 RepID=A0ABT5HGZ6_9CAUL|nr:TetR/AcrR family transcriptional regulator [Asticcacaulis machinosus]MDC7675525.1 TetR/AcrR family transcriptional regulator [Asticcacaulis machinosus]
MKRLSKEDWITFARALIVREGQITLETLCRDAKRTRGSFYHHFEDVKALRQALLETWRTEATDAIITQVDKTAGSRALALRALAQTVDHRFERALRAASLKEAEIAQAVEDIDRLREAYIAELIDDEFQIGSNEAGVSARLIYSVFLSGQMRAPDDMRLFTRGAYDWLLKSLASEKNH